MCCSWTENGIFHTGPGRFPDCPPDRNHVPSDAVTPAARAAGLLQAVSSHLLQKLLSSGKQGERQGNTRVFRGAGMSGNKFNLYRKTRRPEVSPDRPVAQSNAELTREGKGRSSSAPPSDWSRRMKSAENCLAPDSEAAEKLRRRNPSSPLQYDAAGSGRCSFEKIFPKGCFPELRPCGAGSGRRCTSPPVGKAAAGLTESAARRSPSPDPAATAGCSRTAVPQRVCPVFCSRCRFPRFRPGWNFSFRFRFCNENTTLFYKKQAEK